MNTITIATFNTGAAADKVRQRLNDQGIQAKVNNQRLLQRIWFLAKPYSAYHLEVPETERPARMPPSARCKTMSTP